MLCLPWPRLTSNRLVHCVRFSLPSLKRCECPPRRLSGGCHALVSLNNDFGSHAERLTTSDPHFGTGLYGSRRLVKRWPRRHVTVHKGKWHLYSPGTERCRQALGVCHRGRQLHDYDILLRQSVPAFRLIVLILWRGTVHVMPVCDSLEILSSDS